MKSLAAQHSPFAASFNRLSVDEVKMNGWSRFTGANWKAKDWWRSGREKRWLPTDISPESSFGLHRKNGPGMVGVNGKIMTPESSVFVHKWTDLVTLPFLFLLRLVFCVCVHFQRVCTFHLTNFPRRERILRYPGTTTGGWGEKTENYNGLYHVMRHHRGKWRENRCGNCGSWTSVFFSI